MSRTSAVRGFPESESDPLHPNEKILRRVPNNPNNVNAEGVVEKAAFDPSSGDHDGLSVYRSKFVSPRELANSAKRPGDVWVIELLVKDLINLTDHIGDPLGLTLIPDPQPEPDLPGHVLIIDIRRDLKGEDKQLMRRKREALKTLANRCGAIVYHPDQ